MLKRYSVAIVMALVAFAVSGPAAHAKGKVKYGMAGCGVGSLIFEDDNAKWKQIAASVIDDYFLGGFRMWAITTGTSNCKTEGSGDKAALFITMNKAALAKDVARGEGESVATLSTLMGCRDSVALNGALQRNYDSLFVDSARSGSEVRDEIKRVIKNDAAAQAACG